MFITANEFVSEVHDRNAFSLPSRPGACGLFVGFSDDRRIEVVVRFGVVFVLGKLGGTLNVERCGGRHAVGVIEP